MSSIIAPPTDTLIRQSIAGVIRKALVNLYGSSKGDAVIIHDHWLWGFSLGENASLLKVTTGEELGLIHGWLIGLSGVSRARPDANNAKQGVHHLRNRSINRRDVLRSYRVWCYHQFNVGTSAENSENTLASEIEEVADELSRTTLLDIDNPSMMGHEELQFAPIDVFHFNGIQANVAQGTLNVRIQKPLDLNQY